jgi:hypothetical protein
MVVDGERFLGGEVARRRPTDGGRRTPAHLAAGIADGERADLVMGVELGGQFEAQFAGEEGVVVADHQRVGQRQAGERPDRPLAAEDDVIGLFQPVDQILPFFVAVGEGDGALFFTDRGVVGGVGETAVQRNRQQIIPMLGQKAAGIGAQHLIGKQLDDKLRVITLSHGLVGDIDEDGLFCGAEGEGGGDGRVRPLSPARRRAAAGFPPRSSTGRRRC